MKKETKFVLELEGVELPDQARKEISEALNNTLMQKLGTLDLGATTGKLEAKANIGQSVFQMQLPNGGRIMNMTNSRLTTAINELEKISGVKGAIGYNVQLG